MTDMPRTVAHRFAHAFNSQDVDRLLACFTTDASYRDLFYGPVMGHEQIRRLFERMYVEGEHHQWTMTTVVESEGCTIGEWIFTFTVSDAVPASAGRTLRFGGVSVFETSAGLCRAYREYFDRAAALLALGIRPNAVAGLVARYPSVEVSGSASRTLRA
ncbi:MAG TPA: nuclear transport factor 2 family protein [Pseudonocardiaceae bacterium]